jgi:hypothetical protein
MKKITRFSITALIVLCFVLVSFSTVFATPGITHQNKDWSDPVASSSDKGVSFTSVVVSPWQLPGTTTLSSGVAVPVGFPKGELQFGGKGIQISGIAEHKSIQVCFDFPTYNNSWKGKIYEWNGIKWVPVTTTILAPAESNPSACTSSAKNGFYALIIGYFGSV